MVRLSDCNRRFMPGSVGLCCQGAMTRLREDVRRLRFWRAIIGEFLGSLFLILIGCGSYTVSYPEHPITVKVALAFGMTYMAILYCVRTVGDMHFNPSITIAMMVTRRISAISGLLYIAAQTLGSIIGAAFVYGFTAPEYRQVAAIGPRSDGETTLKPTGETGDHLKPTMWWPGGCTAPAEFTTESEAFAVELFATFMFVFVSFAAYDKSKSDGITPAAPFVVGLTYTACILFAMPYTGGSMNTARSFGPAIINDVWRAHWVYWFGPLLGGIIGGGLYDMIFSTKASFDRIKSCLFIFHPAPEPGSPEEASRKKKKKKGDHDVEEDIEKHDETGLQSAGPGAADTELVEVEYTGEPSDRRHGSESKPRLKFYRPKFACCATADAAETHDDAGAAADTPASVPYEQTALDSSTQSSHQQ